MTKMKCTDAIEAIKESRLPVKDASDAQYVRAIAGGDSALIALDQLVSEIADQVSVATKEEVLNELSEEDGATYVGYENTTVAAVLDEIAPLALTALQSGDPDTELMFTQASVDAIQRTTRAKLSEIVSAADFGAAGDGATDDTAALQAAVNFAAANLRRLYIPRGVYMLSSALSLPSNSQVYGDGVGNTELKLFNTVQWRNNVVTIGGPLAGEGVTKVRLSDMTLNSNWPARANDASQGTGSGYTGCGLLIQSSSFITVERIHVIGAYRHGIDITGNAYTSGGSTTGYVERPSHDIILRECEVEGAGDDNITTHQSYNILIEGCYSHDPNGHYVPGNSNCFEIDDGSRHITVTNCKAMGGQAGIEIKGHANAPAPYDVKVSDFTVINSVEGVAAYHTDNYGSPYSPTAFGLEFNNISIIAPCLRSTYGNPGATTQARVGFSISSYQGVKVNNLLIVDSAYGDRAGDFEESQLLTDFPIAFRNGARNVNVKNVTIMGLFKEDQDSSTTGAVTIQHSGTRNITIEGLNLVNYGGRAAYVTTAVSHVRFANWRITRESTLGNYTGASAMFLGAERAELINLFYEGYATGPTFGSTAASWDSWGVGSPEGVVNGKEGSTYRNLSGGTSTTLYVKTGGGVGNTGWTAK